MPSRSHYHRKERGDSMKKKAWYDYLWIVTPVYFALGLFNILFAWLGMIFFSVPLLLAIFGGNKVYCNRYCDRGQFFTLLGKRMKWSANRPTPKWMGSKWFRYGFLIFFFAMFFPIVDFPQPINPTSIMFFPFLLFSGRPFSSFIFQALPR